MESVSTEKGKRLKLKRVVQKKTKVKLNTSGSVAYYKKVKAPLNASLNTSRASQTLKANNKALAQSLQYVKQELRQALNEIDRLRVEKQDLNMKLLRAENQLNLGQDHNSYQQRLQGLKALLNTMSQHLLELGTCVNDGMDLCLVTPRPSQSSTSRPQSLEEFRVNEEHGEAHADVSGLLDEPALECYSETGSKTEAEGGLDQESEVGGSSSSINNMPPTMDMSVIMEQSVLVDEDTGVRPDTHMDIVLEEPPKSKTARPKKLPTARKPPQRVPNGASTKALSTSLGNNGTETAVKKASSDKKHAAHKDTDSATKAKEAEEAKSPLSRRGTFVVKATQDAVCTDLEWPSSGSVEDITSITMPDLVSDSPMKGEETSEVFESSQPPAQDAQVQKPAAKSPTEETVVKKRSGNDSKKPAAAASTKEKRKSQGNKKDVDLVKKKEGVGASKQSIRVSPTSHKDTGFFITNPCALNLVHKRVTGSSEGCLDSKAAENPQPPLSSVESFMAEIREVNRKSTKVASFIGLEDRNASQKPRKSTEKSEGSHKARKSVEGTFDFESDKPEHTIYFNSDMDFTQVLPQTQGLSLQAVSKEAEVKTQGGSKGQVESDKQSTKTDTVTRSGHRPLSGSAQASSKVNEKSGTNNAEDKGSSETLRRSARSKGRVPKTYTEDNASENEYVEEKEKKDNARSRSRVREKEEEKVPKTGDGEDKRPAVALRQNKPGQMVFAASRKEEDGSRKAIPAKLPTKARSKSKKQMEEMIKNLPQKEPEGIFDFHDQTPRPAAADEESVQRQGSVFDLSLDDTMHGTSASLAAFREKLNTFTKGRQLYNADSGEQADCGKDVESTQSGEAPVPSLLGDAPVYQIPLKDSTSFSNEPEPDSRSRSRSTSKGRESGRQSRSKSRSRVRNQEDGEKSENSSPAKQKARRSSRSRRRSEREKSDELDAGEIQASARGRSRSGIRTSDADQGDHSEKSRQSTTSLPQKTCTDNYASDDETSCAGAEEKENKASHARSRKRAEYEEEEHTSPKPVRAARLRGRSRSRRCLDEENGKDKEDKTSESSQTVSSRKRAESEEEEHTSPKPARSRGRSRSRRCLDEENGKDKEDKISESSQTASSRKRADSEEEEYSSPKSARASRSRGRSRSRRCLDEENGKDKEDMTSESSQTAQSRGRSRSRKGDDANQPAAIDAHERRGRSRSRRRVEKGNEVEKKSEVHSVVESPTPFSWAEENCESKKTRMPEDSKDESPPLIPDRKSLKMVTDRRHRSKSSHRKLYNETDIFDNPFGFLDDAESMSQDPQVVSKAEKKEIHPTRSKGTVPINNAEKESSKGEEPTMLESRQSRPPQSESFPEKRKSTENLDSQSGISERHVSPCKKVRKDTLNKENTSNSTTGGQSEAESSTTETSHAGKEAGNVVNSPALKKRRSGLPVVVGRRSAGEEGKSNHTSGQTTARSKAKVHGHKPEQQDECLKFEEIKRRLKELAPSEPSADGDARSQPVKKSRPLVLATANNAAVQSSKTKKSSGGQPAASEQSQSSGMTQQVKKGRPTSNGPVRSGGIESLPGSPRPRSPAYGAAASPRLSADYSSHMHSDDREDSQTVEGRRGRRAAASVCYKEPSLNAKLRRGDPHTSVLHKDERLQIYKSPRSHRKRSEYVDRGALHDLTNQSIAEVETECH